MTHSPYQWQPGQPRIVVTTVQLAEICHALQIPLVGIRTNYAGAFPADYVGLPQFADKHSIDPDALAAIQPDLVISSMEFKDVFAPIVESVGARMVNFRYSTVEQVYDTIRGIGELTGRQVAAEQLIESTRAEMQAVVDAPDTALLRGKKVLILFGTPKRLEAVSDELYLGSLAELLGMDNLWHTVVGTGPAMTPFDHRQMLMAGPEYIITYWWHTTKIDYQAMWRRDFLSNEAWLSTPAFTNHRVMHLTTADVPINGSSHMAADLAHFKQLLLERI